APARRAGLGVVAVDESPGAELAARHSGDNLVLHGQRRAGAGVPGLVVGYGDVPPHAAGADIERDQVRVYAGVVERASENRQPAVDFAAAPPQILGKLFVVTRQRSSGGRIERLDYVGRGGDEQLVVDHDGRGFEGIQLIHLAHPGHVELADVAGVDLVERRIALAGV